MSQQSDTELEEWLMAWIPIEEQPEAKLRLNALIEDKIREASKYQIGVRLVNERRGIWGLNIAHKGRCIFGDIYKSEQKAYDAIPAVIAQLQGNQGKRSKEQ